MSKITIDECPYTKSCIHFNKINNQIIEMVNDHYYDLQMYANYVFYMENEMDPLSEKNNFFIKIKSVQQDHNSKKMILFTDEHMIKLKNLVVSMMDKLKENIISADKYLSDIESIEFFRSGNNSPTILLKIKKIIGETSGKKNIIPLIIKLVPLQLPHHYSYLPIKQSELKNYIQTYIETPSYALFIKEAWMYCFSKNYLLKYTPTFTCTVNSYIINGLPIKNLEELLLIYRSFEKKLTAADKYIAYKKWFDILINKKSDKQLVNELLSADYGCFEMKEIEGTLDNILEGSGKLDLSLVFEYLYTKVITAFIGRIIFTDDHFGNVAYITVDYTRAYHIKCNGCIYNFYMPPGKMVQFIDLERYIFNFSQYDIYTNIALKYIPDTDYPKYNKHLDTIRYTYENNNYIFDKTPSMLLSQNITENNFKDPTEYFIMLNILTSSFVHDIKTFCQIMDINLPKNYLLPPKEGIIVDYNIDLDNESLRIIKIDDILNQIR